MSWETCLGPLAELEFGKVDIAGNTGPVAEPVRSLGFVKLSAAAGLGTGVPGEPEPAREKRLPTTLLSTWMRQPQGTAL